MSVTNHSADSSTELTNTLEKINKQNDYISSISVHKLSIDVHYDDLVGSGTITTIEDMGYKLQYVSKSHICFLKDK